MRFYYENSCGDEGFFTLKNTEIIKAIQSVWNIEAELFIVPTGTNKKNFNFSNAKLIFSPFDDDEFNNDLLKEFNLKIVEGKKYKELRYMDTGELAIDPCDYSNVLDLI